MTIDYMDLLLFVSSIAVDEGLTTLEELYQYLEQNSTGYITIESLEV